MKSMALPQRPYLTPTEPNIIDGPRTLIATLTFYPILEENKKTHKVKQTAPVPQENTIRAVYNTAINVLASSLKDVLANKPGARLKAARLVNWARHLPDQEIAGWREHGRFVGQQYLNENDINAPMVKWAAVTIVCYLPDYIHRDTYSMDEKEIFDGLADCGFFINDSGIIDFRILNCGVMAERPRYEVWIYSFELTKEQEALLEKQPAVKKVRAKKVA